ncbi:hypothetical protein M427DRAFT_130150 [Gonapodya prolifera JEL478]|uniref:GST N-terminal domain-containing protein n=1 Tax=Gonapodya prolifera (strain JEL478) TaxID=1344416 RepID=A0A139B0H9_GONPJ|nr:hypothetical protein M427DRAFT_130150 [Gonapodya prolifera JEL478]|eukprot:KXS22479.1 hypothetical protein M427DRAFT_130150 [Gonapodya prolifera JEL478]
MADSITDPSLLIATPILHGYDGSPYAQKAVLYLQLKGIKWAYHKTSPMMPRPHLTPDLSGGYRRIPILQIGADIYCDSNCIIRELEKRFPTPALGTSGEHEGLSYALHLWSDKFFAVVVNLSSRRPGVPDAFYKDREELNGVSMTAEALAANHPRARDQFRAHLNFLETQLAHSKTVWVLGTEKPHLADVQCWTPVRFAAMYGMAADIFNETNYPAIFRWYTQLASLGFPSSSPLQVPPAPLVSGEVAYAAAELASRGGSFAPSLGADLKDANGRKVGDAVGVIPDDQAVLGRGPVLKGTLDGSSADTISIRWKNPHGIYVVIHFPRSGYYIVDAEVEASI